MSYRVAFIKNLTGTVDIFQGKTFEVDEIKQISDSVRLSWMMDDIVDQAISNGDYEVLNNAQESFSTKLEQRNWLADVDNVPTDEDGRVYGRLATTLANWKFLSHMIEIQNSTADGIFQEDFEGNNRCDFTVVHLDENDNLLTGDLSTCVETRLTIKPEYDIDILKGSLYNPVIASNNCRVYLAIGSFTGFKEDYITYYGSKLYIEFLGGINLKKFTGNWAIDGESTKMIKKDLGYGVDMNMIQLRVKHDPGETHSFMASLEYYRA